MGCLHRFNRCIPTRADTSSIQEVSSLRTRRSSISLFGPTVRNVPKSVNFFETDGRYCSFSTPCHISFSIPRRLADKKSDSQPTDYSDKLLHSNYPKPRFSAKSQEVRSLSCSEIHLHRYGISDATKFSQGSSGSCTEPNSNNQENNVSQTCIGTNFPFSFGQTQCCSRPCSPRQTALTSSSDVLAVCLEPLDHPISINGMIRSHLQWWINPIRFETGTSIHPPDPEFFLYTDASHYGWGAHLEPTTLSFHGRWTENQSQLHINMLEMMAIRLALKQAKTFIHLHAYAFSPFILIPAVLEKIRQHQCRIVLIAPFWPQQQWFSELLLLLVSAPIRLPLIPRLLTQSKGRFVHQNLPILDLHAWELSNNQSEIRNFHKTLPILSPDQEEHLHKKSTMQNGPSSLIGVIQKRLIRSRPLLQL